MVKRIFLILLIFSQLNSFGVKYWVATNGSNANAGTELLPFASLSWAATIAQQPGDTIFIGPGTYQDNTRCVLSPGVHITGSGINSTFIYTTYDNGNTRTDDGYIRMYTSALTQDGLGQSLSHFTLKGCDQQDTLVLTSQRGIVVWHRENVEIHHVRVANFEYSGIVYWGANTTDMDATPSYYQKGNSVHHCQLHNCANSYLVRELHEHLSNCLRVGGQDGFLCYENDMSQTGRDPGYNWDIMGGSWNKDFKIYSNRFTKDDTNGSEWNFFFELFRFMGGGEIHHNIFRGNACADIVCVEKDDDTYGLKIYSNVWDTYNSTKLPWPDPHGNPALDIENRDIVEGVEVYDNDFKNMPCAFWISMYVYTADPIYSRNIKIHHNRFLNIGSASGSSGRALWYFNNGSDNRINTSNIQIYNNTVETDGIGGPGETGESFFAICYEARGKADSIIIRNNIITGTIHSPGIYISSDDDISNPAERTITNLIIQNNLQWGNGWNNQVMFDPYVRTEGRVVSGNIVGNPLFESSTDLHLTTGSPAIDAGHPASPYDTDGTVADIGAWYFNQGTPDPDTGLPVVSNFELPLNSTTLMVPIFLLTGVDNVGVTHYYVSESSVAPLPLSEGWKGTAPLSYSFTTPGQKTLYAFVKDAAGNISLAQSAQVNITLPPVPGGNVPARMGANPLIINQKIITL